jgi:hypothetical protein
MVAAEIFLEAREEMEMMERSNDAGRDGNVSTTPSRKGERMTEIYWLKSRVDPQSGSRQKALNVLPTMILS